MSQLKFEEHISLNQPFDKLKWGLLDYSSLEGIIKVFMWGQENHKDKNEELGWKGSTGYRYSKLGLMESMQRHLSSMMQGEELDPQTKLPHVWHLKCNAMMYHYFHIK